METRTISARPDVTLAPTAARVTPTPPRASRFGEVLSSTVVRSAESAMSKLPGAPMMALAVRSAAGTSTMSVPVNGMASAHGPIATGAAAPNIAGALPTGAGALGEGGGLETSLQQSQDMNLYFLQIQEAMSAQNREYTAISNVLKAKHDTVKTAIGNIR
jgi:hypothetical protein